MEERFAGQIGTAASLWTGLKAAELGVELRLALPIISSAVVRSGGRMGVRVLKARSLTTAFFKPNFDPPPLVRVLADRRGVAYPEKGGRLQRAEGGVCHHCGFRRHVGSVMCFLSKREQVRLSPMLMAVTVRHTTRVAMLAAARLANDRQASDDAAEAKTAEAASVANYQGWLARLAKGGAEAVAGADRAVSGVGGGGWVKPAWWGSQEAVAVREWRMSDAAKRMEATPKGPYKAVVGSSPSLTPPNATSTTPPQPNHDTAMPDASPAAAAAPAAVPAPAPTPAFAPAPGPGAPRPITTPGTASRHIQTQP